MTRLDWVDFFVRCLPGWRESSWRDLSRCVCYRPPVYGLCPNYELVEFQPRAVTPPKPRLCCLLLHIYYWPSPPYPPIFRCPSGVGIPSCPDNPSTDFHLVSTQDNPPTWVGVVLLKLDFRIFAPNFFSRPAFMKMLSRTGFSLIAAPFQDSLLLNKSYIPMSVRELKMSNPPNLMPCGNFPPVVPGGFILVPQLPILLIPSLHTSGQLSILTGGTFWSSCTCLEMVWVAWLDFITGSLLVVYSKLTTERLKGYEPPITIIAGPKGSSMSCNEVFSASVQLVWANWSITNQ